MPCSKELYPIGFSPAADGVGPRPKVVSHYVLEKMRLAGVTKAYIVLRPEKWDIPSYYGNGSKLGMSLAYLMTNSRWGPAYTLDEAYPFLQNTLVAFGFPDIVFDAADPYRKLLDRLAATGADIVLGLFFAPEPRTVDMVHVGPQGRVRSLVIKPRRTTSRYTWLLAVWSANFTRFMHSHLQATARRYSSAADSAEVSVGDVFQAALGANLYFDSVAFDAARWLDIGTPENLIKISSERSAWC